jgi:hypothetical protein
MKYIGAAYLHTLILNLPQDSIAYFTCKHQSIAENTLDPLNQHQT